jgi:hypothetical protein
VLNPPGALQALGDLLSTGLDERVLQGSEHRPGLVLINDQWSLQTNLDRRIVVLCGPLIACFAVGDGATGSMTRVNLTFSPGTRGVECSRSSGISRTGHVALDTDPSPQGNGQANKEGVGSTYCGRGAAPTSQGLVGKHPSAL